MPTNLNFDRPYIRTGMKRDASSLAPASLICRRIDPLRQVTSSASSLILLHTSETLRRQAGSSVNSELKLISNRSMNYRSIHWINKLLQKPRKHTDANRIWKSLAAGLRGSAAHSCLMFLKSWAGVLPSSQPYDDLQQALRNLVGPSVHPVVPWALSFFNGAVVLGFLLGRTYQLLPGRSGAAKGFIFGVLGWIVMGLLFFPALGRGAFAIQTGLGVLPAFFSLLMLLTYSIIMGIAYSALNPKNLPKPQIR